MLGLCGEALTKKLRLLAFTNLLRQDIAFYDDPKHGTGQLCTRLATDVPNVRYVSILFLQKQMTFLKKLWLYGM